MRQIEEYFPRALLERYGATVAEAGTKAARVVDGVITCLEALPAERLKEPVAPGKWTPLEVADHLHRVTLLYLDGVMAARRGEEPVRHERGWITDDGGLAALLPGAEPRPGVDLAMVTRDLRASTAALLEAAADAVAAGASERVCHVNPYFGELTPLGVVQMSALHARHHQRRHLDPLKPGAVEAAGAAASGAGG
jgi:hypothetical protein